MDPIGSHENSITNLIFLTWAYKELQLSLIMNNEITKHSAPEAVPRLQKSSESFVSREIIPSIIKNRIPDNQFSTRIPPLPKSDTRGKLIVWDAFLYYAWYYFSRYK